MKPFAAIVLAVLLMAGLAMSGAALESKVYTLTEKTLSMDLGPGFEISAGSPNASQKGIVSQEFVVNNTAGRGADYLTIISVYDQMMSRLSPGVLSELFLTGVITVFEADGDKEVGNGTTTDRMGKNVKVHTMSTRNPHLKPLGGTYGIACWSLDRSTYAILVSMLDRNNATQIIRTLAIA